MKRENNKTGSVVSLETATTKPTKPWLKSITYLLMILALDVRLFVIMGIMREVNVY